MDAAKVERVYSSYAKVYDHIFGKIFHDGREHAVRLLNLSPGERVLEVGVGTGLGLPSYPRSCEIVGIDLSDGMLNKCRQRIDTHGLKHVQVMRMDAGAMEFTDNSFDAVMAAYVGTAVPDRQRSYVGLGIDAECHAADHCDARRGQLRAKPVGHRPAVACGVARLRGLLDHG